MEFYINTVDDMRNEKDFFYHCNEFEHNLDFEIVFSKSDDELWVFDVSNNNECFIWDRLV